jgi:hypothetical protein
VESVPGGLRFPAGWDPPCRIVEEDAVWLAAIDVVCPAP